MSMTTMSAVEQALKSFYLPGLRYQLNDKASAFLAQVEKSSESVVGKDIIMALRYGRVGGIGNRLDDGDLPMPNSRKTKQAKWETKNTFARFQITDKTIKASKSSAGAFASMLETEISDCETDARLDLSRQVLGDGFGTLCTIKDSSIYAAGSPPTITIEVDDVIYLAEGMLVDIYNSTSSPIANATFLEVIYVDEGTNTVKLEVGSDISSNVVADCFLVVAGNYSKELTGVGAILSPTGILYGISKEDYPWLKPQVKELNGEISDNVIQMQIDNAETRTGSKIDYIQCSLGVRRAYIDLLNATKRSVNTLDLKGGWKAISYNGIPIVADKYIKAGEMHLFDLNDWAMYQMSDYDWLDMDGSMFTRVANKAAFEATLAKYCDIGCQRPRGQALISGITEH
jgi:hypothetical protein